MKTSYQQAYYSSSDICWHSM